MSVCLSFRKDGTHLVTIKCPTLLTDAIGSPNSLECVPFSMTRFQHAYRELGEMEKEKTEHFHLLDKALQANLDSGALYDLIRDYKDTVDDLKEILTARAHLELLERIFDDGHYDEDGKWIPANIEWNIG